VVAFAVAGCDAWRCHTGHESVRYHEAKWSTLEIGDAKVPMYTPARCSEEFVCDVACADVDAGRLEAHEPHEPLRSATVIDERCELRGDAWAVR
jgi:hypothetical protein